jgi:hypothetical protein
LDDIQDAPNSSKSLSLQLSSSSLNSNESESNTIKPSFTFPKAKASAAAIGFISNLIHKVKTLETSEVFTGGTTEVHSFASSQLFKCNGFYNSSQIMVKDASSYIWIILVGFILAIIFTMVLATSFQYV